jgi:hypothetical protein
MATSFIPKQASSTSISASTTSAGSAGNLAGECPQVRLYNSGAVTVFVRWGVGAQTALTTDMALAPGSVEAFTKQNADTLAAITSSGEATLYVICGTGD